MGFSNSLLSSRLKQSGRPSIYPPESILPYWGGQTIQIIDHEHRPKGPLTGKYLDPVDYCREVLHQDPIPIIAEVLRSLREPPCKTLVKSGHAIGKTWCAAVALNWWFDTFDPCVIISTAPTAEHVRSVLWKEVRLQRMQAGLPACSPPSAPIMQTHSEHYAIGITARVGESFQGRHRKNMLFLMDECVGIVPIWWESFKSMFNIDENHVWLAICNPTDQASEAYAQDHLKGAAKWRSFSISSLDHPNIVSQLRGDKQVIPGAVSVSMVNDWVDNWCERIDPKQEIIRTGKEDLQRDVQWPPPVQCNCGDLTGEPEPTCKRCDGTGITPAGPWYRPKLEFECRALGIWPTMARAGVWSEAIWQMCVNYGGPESLRPRLPESPSILPEIGIDCASHGDDYSSFFVRWGGCGMHHEEANGWDPVRIFERTMELAQRFAEIVSDRRPPQGVRIKANQIRIKIDDDGTGGGVIALLRRADMSVSAINSNSLPMREGWYPNRRSELWFSVRDMAKRGEVDLSRLKPSSLDRLKAQAMVVEYQLRLGMREVEPKKITKQKCGRSPDSMDSMNLAWYAGRGLDEPVVLDEPKRPTLDQRIFGRKR